MAKLLCVNANTYRPGVNNIGDVVCVKDDSYRAGPAERDAFTIVQIAGFTREQVENTLVSFLPAEMKDSPTKENETKYTVPKYRFRVADAGAVLLEDKIALNVVER